MRIRYKVALVGGIPIATAVAIAGAAWLLLSEGERARNRAVLAATAHSDLVLLTSMREEYILGHPANRENQAKRMADVAERARARLDDLARSSNNPGEVIPIRRTGDTVHRYGEQIDVLQEVTARNDQLVREMNVRAASLVLLSDRARDRQHRSNTDIIAEITQKDGKLRQARAIVGKSHDLQAAVLADRLERANIAVPPVSGLGQQPSERARVSAIGLASAATELAQALREQERRDQADQLVQLMRAYEGESQVAPAVEQGSTGDRMATWLDRLLKVNATEERSLHDELTQLLTYSVQAAETEQATQNLAITVLELSRRTGEALAGRDVLSIDGILKESRAVSSTLSALPISPLIQSEMVQATKEWRDRLTTTSQGLRVQNDVMASMNAISAAMIDSASRLSDLFRRSADRIGHSIRSILLFGAGLGFLLGTGTAYIVARSITRPLRQLQDKMIELAADPTRGLVASSSRRDELGAMARATNLFLTEIGTRERALRAAKGKADAALTELRATQASLIQAEKLASLGQLVAGVAHEINTPLGVALTTSTALTGDIQRLQAGTESGSMRRSDLTRIVDRFKEGTNILLANLTRAADLVHSFKQVAVDQVTSERRRFNMKDWIQDVLTSLGPVLRKSDLKVDVDCPSDLVVDSYPGALAQVITNFVTNAQLHGYPDGRPGQLTLVVSVPKPGSVRLEFADDGNGIDAQHLGRVFDPFFTTGRERGSTGLGLHIVHNLVTQTLQGRIKVESSPGRGTRFRIDFPIEVTEPVPERAPAVA